MINLLIFLGVLASFTASASIDGINADSGIVGPPYSTIVSDLKSLVAKYPQKAQVITYGKTVQGKPLTIVRISQENAAGGFNKAIYIGGSIHGNEYLNIEDRLPKWFLEQSSIDSAVTKFLNQGGVVYIAPILNPDGYDARQRVNANGADLNRDFSVAQVNVVGFKQPETKSLVTYLREDLLRTNKKLALALDYHCCIGAMLYPWSFNGPVLGPVDKAAHEDIAKIMTKFLGPEIKVGTVPRILGYTAVGGSIEYYFEMGALGLAFEGRLNIEDRYFTEHTKMWDGIVKKLLE